MLSVASHYPENPSIRGIVIQTINLATFKMRPTNDGRSREISPTEGGLQADALRVCMYHLPGKGTGESG